MQALTDETLRRVAAVLRACKEIREREFWIDGSEDVAAVVQAHRAVRQPESFAALVNSISNSRLLEYYRLSGTSPETVDFDLEAPDVLNELKLTPSQLEGLQQGMRAEDLKTEKVPLGAEEEKEESVSSDRRRRETLESQNEAIDEAPTQEPPRDRSRPRLRMRQQKRPQQKHKMIYKQSLTAREEGLFQVLRTRCKSWGFMWGPRFFGTPQNGRELRRKATCRCCSWEKPGREKNDSHI